MKHRLKSASPATYVIFGYGSLLNHNSLSKTIPDRSFTPALIKGWRRVFNCRDGAGSAADVLNLVKDGRTHCNGVIFSVSEDELTNLKRREDVYNFEPVTAYDFATGKKIGQCLTSIDPYVSLDHGHNLPDKEYFRAVREAAYKLGENFGRMWDETTCVAGGEKISDWLKKNKSYDTITDA